MKTFLAVDQQDLLERIKLNLEKAKLALELPYQRKALEVFINSLKNSND